MRPVITGNWLGKDWIILQGLKSGDKVIVDNLIKIRPGTFVSPRPVIQEISQPSLQYKLNEKR